MEFRIILFIFAIIFNTKIKGNNIMDVFSHYVKHITLCGERYDVKCYRSVDNIEFEDILLYTRRLLGYCMYPRWCAIRMYMAEVLEVLRRNRLWRWGVKRWGKELCVAYDAFERRHVMDFDEDFIDVMSGSVSSRVLPKLDELRAAIGGVLLREGVHNYVVYSYPETLVVLCQNSVSHYDAMMGEIVEKYGIDFSNVFVHLRGDRILGASYKLLCEIEDVVGEKLPVGVDATGTGADAKLHSFERMLVDPTVIRNAIVDAVGEMPKDKVELSRKVLEEIGVELDKSDGIAETLGAKYKVSKL